MGDELLTARYFFVYVEVGGMLGKFYETFSISARREGSVGSDLHYFVTRDGSPLTICSDQTSYSSMTNSISLVQKLHTMKLMQSFYPPAPALC